MSVPVRSLTLGTVVALVLGACGSASTSTAPAAPGASVAASGSVRLVLWEHAYPAGNAVVEKLVGDFKAQHPDVTVAVQFIPYDQYFDKLVTALRSGTGPDVFKVPEEMSEQLIGSKTIAGVPSDVVSPQTVDQEYLPATVGRWKANGQYYGLPTDVQTVLLFANTDLLEQCGGDPSKLPTTWDELATQAAACTKRDANGQITQAGLDTRYKWAVYTQAMYSMVREKIYDPASCKVNLTSPDVIQAWRTATSFATGPNAADSPAFFPGQRKFENGKAVFYINHPITMGTLKNFPAVHYKVGQPPTPDGAPRSLVHSWAYVVNAKSANAVSAWRLVKFLTDENAQRTFFQMVGSLPATKSLLSDPTLAADDAHKVTLASLQGAREVETITQKADDVTDATWDQIVTGGTDVAKALADAERQIDPLIASALNCGS